MDLQYTTLLSFLLLLFFFNQQLHVVSSFITTTIPTFDQPEESKLSCSIATDRNGKEETVFCPSLGEIDVQITKNYERGVEILCIAKDVNLTDIKLRVGDALGFSSKKCNLVDQLHRIFEKWDIRNTKEWYVQNFSDRDFVLDKRQFDNLDVSMIKIVSIHYSNIVGIEPDAFYDFVNLEVISLKWNRITNLPDFTNSKSLKLIDLGSNHLLSLPDRLMLPSLRSLLLWTNNITSINETCFANTTQLKVLELRMNQIKNLPEKLLNPLTELAEIGLSYNDFTEIPANFFERNGALGKIDLSSVDIEVIPEDIFVGLSNLTTLMLRTTRLETLPKDLFANQSNLQRLYLGDGGLKRLPAGIFDQLEQLNFLEISNNLLAEWNPPSKKLTNLKTLNLSRNKFVRIGPNFSLNIPKLTVLNLRKNNISYIDPTAFNSLELKVLDLSHNNLTDTEDDVSFLNGIARVEELILAYNFYETVLDGFEPKTKNLDLSYNKIKNISLSSMINLEKGIFNNNEINTINFAFMDVVLIGISTEPIRSKTELNIDNNPINCDCDVYPLIQYFDGSYRNKDIYNTISLSRNIECHGPLKMTARDVTLLKSESFSCDYTAIYQCPDICTCEMYPKYMSFNVSCAHRNLRYPPIIPQFTPAVYGKDPHSPPAFVINKLVIDLRNNSIANFTVEDSSYVNASELYLSDNRLAKVTWLPAHLEVLQLEDNGLENLGYDAINSLNNSKTLRRLTLHHNRWNCNCKLLNFTRLIKSENWKIPFEERILCSNGQKVIGLVEGNLCGFDNQVALIAIGSCFFLFLMMIVVALILYYKYEYHVRVWLYSKPIFTRFVREEELDKDKIYDAFLSYSHKDEEFITNELVPELEGGANPYKLCIHVRDFVVGDFIAKQIVESVEKSRRTIIVLSAHFLKSEWATMEFRTAHTQAMKEGRHRLIVILYDDIDPKTIEDEDLRAYLSTNTYVKWGDPWFWKKLKYVLPHKKDEDNNNDVRSSRKKLMNKKMENIMVTIDKMDLINSPATPNLGTPPAVSLDPLLLKGNSLSFKSNSNVVTPPAEAGLITSMTS